MKFTNTTESDIEQLTEWIQNDPYHKECLNPHWWLTGNGLQCFCLQDSKGPTMYVRLDKEDDLMRVHTQFAPESEVSKVRVVKAIIKAIPVVSELAKQMNMTGLIFKSVSPSLISFLQTKFGFTPTGSDDYWKPFEKV